VSKIDEYDEIVNELLKKKEQQALEKDKEKSSTE
jgi:hypothetical protein